MIVLVLAVAVTFAAHAQTVPAVPSIPSIPPPPGLAPIPSTPLTPEMQAIEDEAKKKKEEQEAKAKVPPTPPAIPVPGGADKVGDVAATVTPPTLPGIAPAVTAQAADAASAIPPLPLPSGAEQATTVPPPLPLPPIAGDIKEASKNKGENKDSKEAKKEGEMDLPPSSLAAQLNAAPTGIVLPPAPKLPKVHLHSVDRQKTWLTTLKPVVTPRAIDFNYKRQLLPGTISRPYYDVYNQHLPPAMTSVDRDRWLLESVAANDLNATRALLDMGGDVNLINAEGNTALVVALARGAVDTARLLIVRGANVQLVGPSGVSAYDVAARTGQLWLLPQPMAAR